MIVDPSVVMAILNNEPEKSRFIDLLMGAEATRISAASRVEISAVTIRKGLPFSEEDLAALLRALGITVMPLTEGQADAASSAYRCFGRSTGHPAKLNFGDCFSYALARETGEPLLFKGDDFRLTDVRAAA